MQSKPVKELDEYAELNLEKVDEFGAEDFLAILTICENHLTYVRICWDRVFPRNSR